MRTILLFCLAAAAFLPVPAVRAEVETRLLTTLTPEKKPVDVALSADGLRLFVLVEGGEVLIYSSGGKLQETVKLDGPAERLALSPKNDVLYASSGETGKVQVIRLEFVQQISSEGSPVKGLRDAPVTVAVFNDFQ